MNDTAILLIGHYRTFDYSSIQWRKFQKLGASFFIHTWGDTFAPGSQNKIKSFTPKNKENILSFDENASIENQQDITFDSLSKFPSYYSAHARASINVLQRVLRLNYKRIVLSRLDVSPTFLPESSKGEAKISFKKNVGKLPSNAFNDLILILHGDDVEKYLNAYLYPESLKGSNRFEDMLEQRLNAAQLTAKKVLELDRDVDILRFNPMGGVMGEISGDKYLRTVKLARFLLWMFLWICVGLGVLILAKRIFHKVNQRA